ncbi:MAG: ribonuclease Z [Defluviitaleaceae bacterium]|nr:ribonuclease Z [Defluviitaleaceae bacterium]
MLDIALLGTGGMMPLPNRFLTSLLVRQNGHLMVIDSGESTQVTMKLLGWGFKDIDVICYTHFHADHISGLPGLLLTIGNSCREEPLLLVGPPGLGEVVRCLRIIAPDLPFPIEIMELPYKRGLVHEEIHAGPFLIGACPLEHRGPCFGYRLVLNRAGKFDVEKAQANNVPMRAWSRLQKAGVVEHEGVTYTANMVMGPPRKPLKLSYCTDTRPVQWMRDFVRDSDLFICEGLYGDDAMQGKAAEHMHMVFGEAAKIARDAGVGELWLTHFSPAMPDPGNYIDFARRIFRNSRTGYDRMVKTLRFEDEEEAEGNLY